jgi:hypothetical protein
LKKKQSIQFIAGTLLWLGCLYIISNLLAGKVHVDEAKVHGAVHLKIAFISLAIKSLFVIIILIFILPAFSRQRKFGVFIYRILLLFAICYGSEFITPSFFVTYPSLGSAIYSLFHNPFWWINLIIYLIFLSILFAYYFTREWLVNEKLKRELVEVQYSTELKFLKNQVNPHFLFNTLNNLFSLAQKNKDGETADGISKLAGLMRYMIYDSSTAKVSLHKEIKNIRDYLGLARLRYPEDELEINFNTTGCDEEVLVAPMIFLPFIENCFKHGTSIEKLSVIDISLETTGGKIIFRCSNSIARNKDLEQEGIGLPNVKRRLELLYPNRHTLQIDTAQNKFTVYLTLDQQ